MGKLKKTVTDAAGLFRDITDIIDSSRKYLAYTANTTLVMVYWKIGTRINSEVLQHSRGVMAQRLSLSWHKP
jgi:hypothetical protein